MLKFLDYEYGKRQGALTRKRPGQKSGTPAPAPVRKSSMKAGIPPHHDNNEESYYEEDQDVGPRMVQHRSPPPAYNQQEQAYYSKRPSQPQQQEVDYNDYPRSDRRSAHVDARPSRRDEAAFGNGQDVGMYPAQGNPQASLRRAGSGASSRGSGRMPARADAYEDEQPELAYRRIDAPPAVSARDVAHPFLRRGGSTASKRSTNRMSAQMEDYEDQLPEPSHHDVYEPAMQSSRGHDQGSHRDSYHSHRRNAIPATARSSHHSKPQHVSAHREKPRSRMQSVKRSEHGSKRQTVLAPIQEDRYYASAAEVQQGNYGGQLPIRSRSRRSSALPEEEYDDRTANHSSRHSKHSGVVVDLREPSHKKEAEPSHGLSRDSRQTAQFSIHNDFAAPSKDSRRSSRDSGYHSGQTSAAGLAGKRHAKLYGGDRDVTLADF
ncbi:MAG: hypothetical protein L6R40_004720 [Gallowayella cf. fulva]|nr:MAG: hypothetical protein L6R40_004720 [Xanthomendoza cf. fulva]